jgi:hypothetical protein
VDPSASAAMDPAVDLRRHLILTPRKLLLHLQLFSRNIDNKRKIQTDTQRRS